MATKSTTEITVPGIENTNQIPQGQNVAIFVRGLELFTSIGTSKASLKAKSGDPVEANIVGTKAGRLFSLASEMMSQAPGSMLASQQPGGYNFLDVSFYNSLTEAYGKGSTEALEPYTVVLVFVPLSPTVPVGTQAPQPT